MNFLNHGCMNPSGFCCAAFNPEDKQVMSMVPKPTTKGQPLFVLKVELDDAMEFVKIY